jgi:hypothetical protein
MEGDRVGCARKREPSRKLWSKRREALSVGCWWSIWGEGGGKWMEFGIDGDEFK